MRRRKTKNQHGGPRPGAGRKPLPKDQQRRRTTVWLTEGERAYLREVGGTISEGVQELLAGKLSAAVA